MIARGFKSVLWVATVGGAALCCYMVSLRVATERADLARVENQIVAAKRDIRSLKTELGTRGRLTQLEAWNSDVLALSAPTSAQFVKDQVTLARLERHDTTVEERSANVRLASAEAPAASPAPAAAPAPAKPEPAPKVVAAIAPAAAPPPQSLVRRASYTPVPAASVDARAKLPSPAPHVLAPEGTKPAKPQRTASAIPAKPLGASPEAAHSAPAKPKPAAKAEKPIVATAAPAPRRTAAADPKRPAAPRPTPARGAKVAGSDGN